MLESQGACQGSRRRGVQEEKGSGEEGFRSKRVQEEKGSGGEGSRRRRVQEEKGSGGKGFRGKGVQENRDVREAPRFQSFSAAHCLLNLHLYLPPAINSSFSIALVCTTN